LTALPRGRLAPELPNPTTLALKHQEHLRARDVLLGYSFGKPIHFFDIALNQWLKT
jgi:hypothetical protein